MCALVAQKLFAYLHLTVLSTVILAEDTGCELGPVGKFHFPKHSENKRSILWKELKEIMSKLDHFSHQWPEHLWQAMGQGAHSLAHHRAYSNKDLASQHSQKSVMLDFKGQRCS